MGKTLTVWKYILGVRHGPQLFEMPVGAKVLRGGLLKDEGPCIWALVDPAAEMETRSFILVGTAHVIEKEPLSHIGTMLDVVGPGIQLVWHVFEMAMEEGDDR